MSVHNSEHNSPNNSDHDDDIHDSVTRISKLDISDPLHLHPNDTTALTVVSIKLKGTENYQVWSCAMLLALEGKNKIDFIDGSCKRSKDDEVLGKQWDRLNAIVLGWILNSISKELFLGLDDSYMQIRSSILSRETLPDVRSAYATISSEESHRVTVGSIASSSQRNQASALVSNVPYSQNFQRSNQNFNTGPSRTNNVNNNRQSGGSCLNNTMPSGSTSLVCENCGFNGYTIDRCFKIIGYPAEFGKKKSGQNFKKQSVSNNNYVGKSSSSEFSDEQMATLISLIKDNKDFDFPVDSRNDADSSNDFVATQNEEVATLEENVFSESNLDQNPSSSQGVQNVRRSSRQSVFSKNYNDFVVESKVKYSLEKYVGYSKLNSENFCFVTQLNKTREPKTYFEASKYSHWIDVINQEMNALLRNGTWELVDLPEGRKAIGSTNHLTKEHLEHTPVKKTLSKLKAQSPLKP
ncbi:ribonuclease H-like domain-containing protein, partial [Tanacetum coccineum]